MVRLQPVHGFAAETASATVIGLASHFGIPVSTTHNVSAAIMGVGAAKRPNALKWTIVEKMVWAWLLTILQRVRTDAFRRRQRRPQTVELTDEGPQLAVLPAQNALASGYEDLERALQALPEAFRTAVVLRDVQDLSYAEIAEALGVPVGTVMSRIHRGRALLRQALGGARP